MAQIDASGLTFSFDAFLDTNVRHFALSDATPDHRTWVTGNAAPFYRITALSSEGDITGAPLGGTIDTVNITNNTYDPGFSITGLDISLADLIDTKDAAANFEKLWEGVLAGETEIILPEQGKAALSMMGDFVLVNAGQTRSGGADSFVGAGVQSNSGSLVGDSLHVDIGATLNGGDDTFTDISNGSIIGDVGNMALKTGNNFGTVNGGNDTVSIVDTGYTPTLGNGYIVGDVFYNAVGGISNGGADAITLRNTAGSGYVIGDNQINEGTSKGGADAILIETTLAGRKFHSSLYVIGDDYQVSGENAAATGGNDTITITNATASTTSGDFYQVADASASGGGDKIDVRGTFPFTGQGPSVTVTPMMGTIVGDAYTTTGKAALNGGDDFITAVNVTTTGGISGDAYNSMGKGAFSGGNDILSLVYDRADLSATFPLLGDAYFSAANSFAGGSDKITLNVQGSPATTGTVLYGDAFTYDATGSGVVKNGDDVLRVVSGAGYDTALYGDGGSANASVNLTLTDGDDRLTAGGGNDRLYGDTYTVTAVGTLTQTGGDDVLDGGGGNDLLYGGLGSDTAVFSLNRSVHVDLNGIAGSASGNLFEAIGQGNDQLEGIDNVTGSALADVLVGNNAANILMGMGGADKLNGGGGIDTASYAGASGAVVVSLANPAINTGDAAGDSFKAIENLFGSGFNDSVFGDNGNNAINGGAGSDTIKGYGGNDTLTGGAGVDFFVFNSALDMATNVDAIADFNVAADTIQLDNAVFTALAATGTLAASAFKDIAVAAKDADDRVIYNSDTGALYYDADGSGGTFGNVKFATLTGAPDLTAADFVVI
ncbi:calcium-binding protein [Mesorhizobium sp. CN2-181]|uniref:beta strand repeat-containing protein n=1 Tax=Mesorhizobium yinganensis TaxID=3157707 RepID=UPI0032B71615